MTSKSIVRFTREKFLPFLKNSISNFASVVQECGIIDFHDFTSYHFSLYDRKTINYIIQKCFEIVKTYHGWQNLYYEKIPHTLNYRYVWYVHLSNITYEELEEVISDESLAEENEDMKILANQGRNILIKAYSII